MKQKILNLFCFLLSSACFFILLQIVLIKANANSFSDSTFRVKSHLIFDKKIIGKAQVLDGDSIKIGRKEIRLFGIDAPEYKQKCLDKNNQEYSCGLISRDFLFKLANQKSVECFYAQKDKYDRFLSKCFVEEQSINEEMIKNGMAVIYNFTESSSKMDKLETEAKNNKIGIWQGSFELPKDYRKNNPRI
ncbi:MAG: thermonuclease family protein [Alphaproteobacteria bacterium]|nr:thermonuclease family protein [Alphaproteobacteria bacterium]